VLLDLKVIKVKDINNLPRSH